MLYRSFMPKNATTPSMILLSSACLLVIFSASMAHSQEVPMQTDEDEQCMAGGCDDHSAEGRERRHSLLQVKRTATNLTEDSCKLPSDGTWVEVRLKGAEPFKMAVRKGHVIEDSIKEKGYWEVEDTAIWGPPGQALDIGGNVGYYTFALAQTGWKVTTFEPMDHNIEFIKATLCKNPDIASRVELLEIGLGTQNKRCAVIEIFNNIGNGMVRCEGDTNQGGSPWTPWDFTGSSTRGEFQLRRLDEVLREKGIKQIDFIKLDVEGYECEAMKGAGGEDFLRTYHPRIVKSEVWMTQERCIAWDFLTMFENAGYRIGKDNDPECKQGPITSEEKYGGGNMYMCK